MKGEGMTMDEARGYCLELERDRERKWRQSAQGRFEAGMVSYDSLTDSCDGDGGKMRVFSDRGRSAASAMSSIDCAESEAAKARKIKSALARLKPKERDFALAVLSGKSWRELGIPKRTFNYRLARIAGKVRGRG